MWLLGVADAFTMIFSFFLIFADFSCHVSNWLSVSTDEAVSANCINAVRYFTP